MPYKNQIIQPANYSEQHRLQTSQFYKGFSTLDPQQRNSKLYDFDVIKQDLMNQFSTKKGERVMNPEFGSIIWSVLFEPFTQDIRNAIDADIKKIIESDPRITSPVINVAEAEYGLLLEVTMTFTGTDQSETLRLTFDKSAGLSAQ
jgi:phage baseplate assembly protein W